MPFKKDVTIALMVPLAVGGFQYLEIPVNPNSITFTSGNQVLRPTVLGIGELNQIGPKKLKTISWSSHFPEVTNTYVNYDEDRLETPQLWKDRFEKYQRSPFTLLITNIGLIQVTMDSFTWNYGGRTGKDINYEVKFTEYKQVVIRALDTKKLASTANMLIHPYFATPLSNSWSSGYFYYTIVKENEDGIRRDTLATISSKFNILGARILAINSVKNFDELLGPKDANGVRKSKSIIRIPIFGPLQW